MEDYLSFSQPPSQIYDLDEDFIAVLSEFTYGLGDDAGLKSTKTISEDSGMEFAYASGKRLPRSPSPPTPKDHPASVPAVSPTIVADSASSLSAFPSEPARTTFTPMYPTHGMPQYQHFPEQLFPAAFGPMGPGIHPIFHAYLFPAPMDPSAPGPVAIPAFMPWPLPQHAFTPWPPRQPASQPAVAAAAPLNKRAFEFVQPTVPDGFVANPNNHGRWEIDSVGNRKYLNAPKIKRSRVIGN